MWECLKSVLLLMTSRGPAPLVMNMSLHLSSFMNSQSFFLIFFRCSRTLNHVQLVDCNVNSPRTSLHCKKQTNNKQGDTWISHGPSPFNDEIYVMRLADVERIIEVLLNSLHKGVHWAMGRWHSWNEWTNAPPNTLGLRVGFCPNWNCVLLFFF